MFDLNEQLEIAKTLYEGSEDQKLAKKYAVDIIKEEIASLKKRIEGLDKLMIFYEGR